MVKFGRHCKAFQEENADSDLFVVDYNAIRNNLIENIIVTDDEQTDNGINKQRKEEKFTAEWRRALRLATADFDRAMVRLWKLVFEGIQKAHNNNNNNGEAAATSNSSPVRGALPDTALRLYLTTCGGVESAQELLFLVKRIHNTALTNVEALRKLVKKFDKQHQTDLCVSLLPEVYGANFTVGQSNLQAGISLIRASLGMNVHTSHVFYGEYENDDDDVDSVHSEKSSTHEHSTSILRRKAELDWLRGLVESIAAPEVAHLVAHRGFHDSTMDRTDCRPLENSLSAYEAAWTSGVHLCECDIALTKDEKLILAHDENFTRLALDPSDPVSRKGIGELTYREFISLPLTSGNRPPLLIDILRSAAAIGGPSQLIIEIKPGNVSAGSALARLFLRHPPLMARCAAVMSFDAFAMHSLRRDLKVVMLDGDAPAAAAASQAFVEGTASISLPTTMSLGNIGYSVSHVATIDDSSPSEQEEKLEMQQSQQQPPLGHKGRQDSTDHFGVGLSESFAHTRSDSFSFTPFGQFKVFDASPRASPKPSPALVAKSGGGGGAMLPPLDLPPAAMKPPSGSSPSNGGDKAPIVSQQHSSPSMTATTTSPKSQNLPPLNKGGMAKALAAHYTSESKIEVPKLLLLTVAQEPNRECELRTSVSDLSQVDHWLRSGDGSCLDGVYLQFEREMLTAKGAAALRDLADRVGKVGVWGYSGRDPDCWESFHHLVREGRVRFVNTDLPRNFKRGSLSKRGVTFGY